MLRLGDESAECRVSAKDVLCLAVERSCAACVRQGEMRFRELEPSLHCEPGQSMRHHRAYPLGCDERRSGPRALPLGDCEPRRGRQHDRGHDIVRRRDVFDERAGQGKLRLGCGEIASLQREKRPLGARDHARPGRSARDGRVGSLTQNGLRSVDLSRKQQSPSRAGGWRRGTTGSCRAVGRARARRRSASARRRPCRARRAPWQPRSRGRSPSGIGPSVCCRFDRQRPALGGFRPATQHVHPHPQHGDHGDTVRAGRDRRSAPASARPWSRGRSGSTSLRARRRAWPPQRCRPLRWSTRSPPPAVRSPRTTRPLCD